MKEKGRDVEGAKKDVGRSWHVKERFVGRFNAIAFASTHVELRIFDDFF